ncbi:MAG TPA: MBL fold metallo-hydrolase [Pyrinomonadaceae bacterium]|jgi:glyoxylase-like metal-dependent hydrolase (beta-lactamase superfamily II)/ferredoxin
MANRKLRLAENVEGAFFVDETCIDCDTCRQLAPASFRDHGGQSSVYRQPASVEETRRALMALVACPSGSIGAGERLNAKTGINAFPFLIAENVYYCGFNSEKSFGAWSYLIVRPPEKGGNVLIDSPRFAAPLVRQIEKMGGVRQMFLTHRDDIAEHQAFHEKFGAARIMHAADGAKSLGVEQIIEGEEAFKLDDELTVIPVAGHTRGSQVLLYKNKFLFTGDHLAWSPRRASLIAFRSVAWYSWAKQTRSMEKLLGYDFEWVLPGHGRIAQRPKQEMREHLIGCIEWMKRV